MCLLQCQDQFEQTDLVTLAEIFSVVFSLNLFLLLKNVFTCSKIHPTYLVCLKLIVMQQIHLAFISRLNSSFTSNVRLNQGIQQGSVKSFYLEIGSVEHTSDYEVPTQIKTKNNKSIVFDMHQDMRKLHKKSRSNGNPFLGQKKSILIIPQDIQTDRHSTLAFLSIDD